MNLTDEQIVAIRDEYLPSQGEPFDCIAFARGIERALQSPAATKFAPPPCDCDAASRGLEHGHHSDCAMMKAQDAWTMRNDAEILRREHGIVGARTEVSPSQRRAFRYGYEAATREGWQAPKPPSLGLLMSMAIRSDHALGMPGYYDQALTRSSNTTHAQRLESTIREMRQLYEEATGVGFYSPEREAEYVALYRRSTNQE